MNNQRRKALKEVIEKINQASDLLAEAKEMLEEVKDEEWSSFDALPWGIQVSERGQTLQDNVNVLDSFITDLEEKADFEELIDSIMEL